MSDRREMLVPADLAIVRMRRYLVSAARQVAAGGKAPGFDDATQAGNVGALYAQVPAGTRWQDLVSGKDRR